MVRKGQNSDHREFLPDGHFSVKVITATTVNGLQKTESLSQRKFLFPN